jgi:hypothetical protein
VNALADYPIDSPNSGFDEDTGRFPVGISRATFHVPQTNVNGARSTCGEEMQVSAKIVVATQIFAMAVDLISWE